MIPRTKQQKSILVRGVILGVLGGAILPDAFNPVVVVRRILAGVR
jgi:hypothetical protein